MCEDTICFFVFLLCFELRIVLCVKELFFYRTFIIAYRLQLIPKSESLNVILKKTVTLLVKYYLSNSVFRCNPIYISCFLSASYLRDWSVVRVKIFLYYSFFCSFTAYKSVIGL